MRGHLAVLTSYVLLINQMLFLGPAQAEGIMPIIGIGITQGGDTAYTFTNDCSSTGSLDRFIYSLSPCQEHKSLELGDGLAFITGLRMPLAPMIEAQLTAAYHYGMEYADNGSGSVNISRYPVEAVLFFKPNNWRIGVGLSQHLWPRARCDIDSPTASCNYVIKFANATGYVLQTDWDLAHMFNPQTPYTLTVGLHYIAIEYHAIKAVGISPAGIEDASNVGFFTMLGF